MFDSGIFQANVRAESARRGWTIEKLAEESGVENATLRSYLRSSNPSTPGLDKAAAISAAFGCSIDALMRDNLATD